MDQRTSKLMTLYKASNLGDDVDILYVSRKEGGRGIAGSKDRVNASIQRLEDDREKRGGRLITATRNTTDNTTINRTKIS